MPDRTESNPRGAGRKPIPEQLKAKGIQVYLYQSEIEELTEINKSKTEAVRALLSFWRKKKEMKRDLDLIRDILIKLEGFDGQMQIIPDTGEWIEGRNRNEIMYQLKILSEAGFIDAVDNSTKTEPIDYAPRGLTWEGHDLLDSIRDSTIWEQTKTAFLKYGGHTALTVLTEIAKKLA